MRSRVECQQPRFVADEDVVLGPRGMRLTKSGSLLGYIVAKYIDGDDEDPVTVHIVMYNSIIV
jgi:hypothetical protein